MAHAKLEVETLHAPGHKQTVEGVGYIATKRIFTASRMGNIPKDEHMHTAYLTANKNAYCMQIHVYMHKTLGCQMCLMYTEQFSKHVNTNRHWPVQSHFVWHTCKVRWQKTPNLKRHGSARNGHGKSVCFGVVVDVLILYLDVVISGNWKVQVLNIQFWLKNMIHVAVLNLCDFGLTLSGTKWIST